MVPDSPMFVPTVNDPGKVVLPDPSNSVKVLTAVVNAPVYCLT